MQGHRKNKWTVEEEEALLAGIAKHGYGKWANIVEDPEFAPQLLDRTNINLKERHEVPQNFKKLLSNSLRILVSQDKLKKVRNSYKISITKATKPTHILHPKDSTNPPELPSTSVISTKAKETQEIDAAANKVAERINELAEENDVWYEERQDFRKFLSECLKILVSQGKLEKVLDRYKISELENKVLEIAPEVVAMKIAESDKKRLIAAEAVEEEQRMHKLVEESHTMLQLCLEIHQQCALGEEVVLR